MGKPVVIEKDLPAQPQILPEIGIKYEKMAKVLDKADSICRPFDSPAIILT